MIYFLEMIINFTFNADKFHNALKELDKKDDETE